MFQIYINLQVLRFMKLLKWWRVIQTMQKNLLGFKDKNMKPKIQLRSMVLVFKKGKEEGKGGAQGHFERSYMIIEPVHADETSLPPEMEDIYHHPSTGIFSSSSYDADFVVLFLGDLTSPVQQEDIEEVKYRTATTPYEASKPKSKDEPDDAVNVHLYRSMIVSPIKKISKYLKGTTKNSLWYPRDSPFVLEAYIDSDYCFACERKSQMWMTIWVEG
ncbi:hypothetical protein Tco_0345807 [Tanacetum coccineum]